MWGECEEIVGIVWGECEEIVGSVRPEYKLKSRLIFSVSWPPPVTK